MSLRHRETLCRLGASAEQLSVIAALTSLFRQLPQVGQAEATESHQHWSAPHRYDGVAHLLLNNQETTQLSPSLQAALETVLATPTLHIRDCAVGQGQAIAHLHSQLKPLNNTIHYTLHDRVNPLTIVEPYVLARLERWEGAAADIRRPPHPTSQYHLSIIGNIHPYVSPADLAEAVLNRAEESQLTVVTPAHTHSKQEAHSTLWVWRAENQWHWESSSVAHRLQSVIR